MPPLEETKDSSLEKKKGKVGDENTNHTTASSNTTSNNNSSNNKNTNDDGDDIPVTSVAMKLLDVRLKPSHAILKSVLGEFTNTSSSQQQQQQQQQICVARTSGILELYDIVLSTSSSGNAGTPSTTSLHLVHRMETYCILRDIGTIRLTGEKRDLLGVTSDSGAWSLIDFQSRVNSAAGSTKSNRGSHLHSSSLTRPQVTVFGKIGCRRATPGQYFASDPKGRAVMVSAVEKRKLVYVLNHAGGGTGSGGGSGGSGSSSGGGPGAGAAKTLIASPLEAHRTRTIVFATTGVDNGYDNPIFAVLEQQYPQDDQPTTIEDTTNDNMDEDDAHHKQLAYYELDLGLNHLSRKWAVPVPPTSCCLVALPGGADGPSGVIIGSENFLSYYHPDLSSPLHCVVPRRSLEPATRGVLMTHLVVHKQKKGKFFGLAQSELGDVYKVSLDLQESTSISTASTASSRVVGIHVTVFDTLPPANSLNISKKGLLFSASEFGDHQLYQFQRIDLPGTAPTNHSSDTKGLLAPNRGDDNNNEHESSSGGTIRHLSTTNALKFATKFTPTNVLQNLLKLDAKLENTGSPTTGLLVGELAGMEVSPQIYTLSGTGPSSQLCILRHGAGVTELAVSELPGVPGGIFTIADDGERGYSMYIVVSFADATLVLSVGDTVEEVGRESGFLTNAPTLACSALRGGSRCQIHPSGVVHIQRGQPKQWDCPGLKRIECATANTSQVLIALTGGEVTYFELDPLSGNLSENATRDMGTDVCCIDAGTIDEGKSRSLFCAIGCRDQTVKIVSLEPGNKILQQKSSLALKSRPHSVSLQSVGGAHGDLILMIGLDDGSSLRATVDPVTGAIGSSPTRRFLGARPVSVSRIPLDGRPSMLLLSSRPWISRMDPASGKHIMAPLSYSPLDHGCSFSSEAVPEGVVATAGKTLRIISVDTAALGGSEDETFNTNKVPLRYTPRQMTLLSSNVAATDASGSSDAAKRKIVLACVESDYDDYGQDEKASMGFDAQGGTSKAGKNKDGDEMDMDEDSDEEDKKGDDDAADDEEDDEDEKAARFTPVRGPRPPGPGHWGSCVRLFDPSDSCRTLDCIEMSRNEAALCCCSVRFHTRGGESLLAVGTVTSLSMNPLKFASSHIILYRVLNGDRLQLLHRTSVDDGPVLTLAHFQGRLLVGIGKTLRLYEMGKRQLLRKCELRALPTYIKTLQTAGDRAYFGDMMRSIHLVRYDPTSNRLVLVASDPSPRPIVCQELLDWNTVAVGDKFGNICVLRLPRGADVGSLDLTGQRALWETSKTDTTAKMEVLCQYYVGSVVTGMTRSSLVAGGAESLIYVTVDGRIGALVPFTSKDDVEFYTQLEGQLRTHAPRPTGRDPQSYRSYYAPAMHVVDGDLCDAFNGMSYEEQNKIAERLDRTIGEIMKKLEDTRNLLL